MLNANTGLLWFDDDPKTDLQTKIRRLIQHYREKYGVSPQLCYIHKSALGNKKALTIDQVEIRIRQSVLPHHFWIGRT